MAKKSHTVKLRAVALMAALATAGGVWMEACSGGQPLPQCRVSRGGYAVRYTPVEGTGPCASKASEVVGMQWYREPGALLKVGAEPHTLYAVAGRDPAHSIVAIGSMTADEPDSNGLCTVPSLSPTQQTAPSPDGGSEGAVDIRYTWSNMRFPTAAETPGTQWTADLLYTEAGCTASFHAVGVYPAVSCAVLDSSGNRVLDGGSLVTNASLCAQRNNLGLALDPAFPVSCDGATGLCVLEGQPPALTY